MDCCYHIFQCIFSTTSSSDGGVSTTTTTCSCSCCFDYLRLNPKTDNSLFSLNVSTSNTKNQNPEDKN